MNKAYERIQRAAARRIVRRTAEREATLAAMHERPLNAETSDRRKLNRIESFVGVTRDVARRIAAYEPLETLGLTERQLYRARVLQGESPLLEIAFVELARRRANAVCRLGNGSDGHGTGFLVSDRLLLTNNHVIPDETAAAALGAEFNFELTAKGIARTVTRFKLDPDALFVTHSGSTMDYTLVALGEREEGPRTAADFGACALSDADDKHMISESVSVVQHPQGVHKRVVLRAGCLVDRHESFLHYLAAAKFGSSGSPVFNETWQVVALHHAGDLKKLPDGTPVPEGVSEGIRISSIVRNLRKQGLDLPEKKQKLLIAAIGPLVVPANGNGANNAADDHGDAGPDNDAGGDEWPKAA